MKDYNPFRENREQLKELLRQYENFKIGKNHSFIEEDAFEKIIDFYQEKDELNKAFEAAEIGSTQFPYSARLIIKKADILLALRRYQEALNLLDNASLLDGADINVYILKTDAYMALDQPEKAALLLEEALALFDRDEKIDLLFELADVYDDYEEFDKVFDCLKAILEEEPNNEEALYKICFWTDFTGRNEESIRLHEQIIDEYPYNELAWFNLAAAYQGLKLYEKAIDAYKYAIAIEEKFDYAYRNMGDAYIRLRQYKEAIEVLEKVTELAQPEDVIFEAIGHCYDRLKNYAQARLQYRKASHLRNDDSRLLYKIAMTYFHEEKWVPCFKQITTALQMETQQADYHILAGECKLMMEEYEDAAQSFANAVRLRPRNVKGWEALIRCLYNAGYFGEALEQTDEAIHKTNGKTIFLFYKAAVLMALQNNKEALLILEEALLQSPKGVKKFVALNPSVLQNQQVVEVIARSKRK